MMQDILLAFWFLLPAALANAAPVFSNKIPFINRWQARLDSGRTFRGKELLGSHKTWRGLIAGMIVSTIVFALQQDAVAHFGWAQYLAGPIPYDSLPLWLLGPLFGLGALGGDAVESFFKRQHDVPSGRSWIPWDQIDYIIGAILISLPFVQLSIIHYVWMLIVWFCLHVGSTYVGWLLKLRDDPI